MTSELTIRTRKVSREETVAKGRVSSDRTIGEGRIRDSVKGWTTAYYPGLDEVNGPKDEPAIRKGPKSAQLTH